MTGITGQDVPTSPSYSWTRGYEVHGLVRRSSLNTQRIDHLYVDPVRLS